MKRFSDYGREWLDTLVVAISVAMAFRAYFFEPFNIPTGSMQETLWGNHTIAATASGVWDRPGLKIFKWLVTGAVHRELTAPVTGVLRVQPRNDGYADISIGIHPAAWKLPLDAARELMGRKVMAGETFWRGEVVTGDFIFVNRMTWNFRRPRVNDVMVFSTTGVGRSPEGRYVGPGNERYLVQQYTHYIKRMKAVPGDTYQLEHPVAGGPERVKMGADEYFACGDNFNNSFDSRYWGPVPGKCLRGTGSFVFWPISGWRVIR